MQLKQDRCATSAKLRKEWERRIDNNENAVHVLGSNTNLWNHVGGPDPESLLCPSEIDLDRARAAAAALRRMAAAHGEKDESMEAFVEELSSPMRSTRSSS